MGREGRGRGSGEEVGGGDEGWGRKERGERESSEALHFSSPFALIAPDYPEQVLTLGEGGEQFFGDSADINQNLEIPETGPTVVDTIGRTAYWYSPSMNRIYSRSLNTGTLQVIIVELQRYCCSQLL